jgi:hypothetical protein
MSETIYGTLDHSGSERTGMTLDAARKEVESDRDHGYISHVVRHLPDGRIDESFDDEKSEMSEYDKLRASIQAVIDIHSKAYHSTGDEAWDRNAICSEEGHAYPCDVRVALEAALA